MDLIPITPHKHEEQWRRRERRRTAACGVLSFMLVLCILSFGGGNIGGFLMQFGKHKSAITPEQTFYPALPLTAVEIRVLEEGQQVTKGQRLPAELASGRNAPFPAFGVAQQPVKMIPNWGAMRSSAEWDRPFAQMGKDDFVPVPKYDMRQLTLPVSELLKDRARNIGTLTAKLYYSTRFFGTYDLDAGEFTGMHAGIDFKLPLGMPVGSIGGGRVFQVSQDKSLGNYVVVEHRLPEDGTFYSVYGHLEKTLVTPGQNISSGTAIGTVGMTGNTTAPHLHLQLDRGTPGNHTRFWPSKPMQASEAVQFTVNPVTFIESHAAMQVARRT